MNNEEQVVLEVKINLLSPPDRDNCNLQIIDWTEIWHCPIGTDWEGAVEWAKNRIEGGFYENWIVENLRITRHQD